MAEAAVAHLFLVALLARLHGRLTESAFCAVVSCAGMALDASDFPLLSVHTVIDANLP
jgi:hypothetical protein